MNDTTCKHCGHPEALHYLTPSHSTRCLAAWSTVSDRGVIGMQQDHRCPCEGFEVGVYTPPETREGQKRREIAERLDTAISGWLTDREKPPAETPVARPGPPDVPVISEESAPARCTTSGKPWTEESRALRPDGQQKDYVILCAEERAKGFVRPVRQSYIHQKCGGRTTMGLSLAETYARDPKFYTATFCVICCGHYPVGAQGEFVWDDGTHEKVGA